MMFLTLLNCYCVLFMYVVLHSALGACMSPLFCDERRSHEMSSELRRVIVSGRLDPGI